MHSAAPEAFHYNAVKAFHGIYVVLIAQCEVRSMVIAWHHSLCVLVDTAEVLYKQAAAKPEKFGLPDNTKHGYSIVGWPVTRTHLQAIASTRSIEL
eukprot:5414252-Amphidinium_carterae.1